MGDTRLRGLAWLVVLVLVGCVGGKTVRTYKEPPPPHIEPTIIEYVDADGFDAVLESALINQDPVILIQTPYAKPEWGARLNAWIAAWNMGGKIQDKSSRRFRSQGPLPSVVVDGDSIREFRLLMEGLMNRVEGLAKGGSQWWTVERMRNYRVNLLRPYNLRFHKDADQNIQLIFFNGQYSHMHEDFMAATADCACDEDMEWSRCFTCTMHKNHCPEPKSGPRQAPNRNRLTSRTSDAGN